MYFKRGKIKDKDLTKAHNTLKYLLEGYQWPDDVKVALLSEEASVSSTWNTPSDEKEAQSFQNDVRRNEFRRSRALIRQLICEHWDKSLARDQVKIQKQSDGRPYIQLEDQLVHIGISYCTKAILIAASEHQIGIDIEHKKREADDRLRARIMTPVERKAFSDVETIRIWTLKEAVLKFLGTGLRFGMNRFQLKRNNQQQFYTDIQNESVIIHSHQIEDFWVAVATHN